MKYYEFEWNEKCPSYNGRYSYMKNLFWIKQWRRKLEAMLNCKSEVTLYDALQELGFNVDEFVKAGEFREVGFTTKTGIKIKINKDFYLALHSNDSNPCATLRFYCIPLNKEEMFYDPITNQKFKVDIEKTKAFIKDAEKKLNEKLKDEFRKRNSMTHYEFMNMVRDVFGYPAIPFEKPNTPIIDFDDGKTSAEWLRDTINDVRHKAKLDDFIKKD